MKYASEVLRERPPGPPTSRPTATIVRLADAARRPRRVAIGKFDGLHLGHRAVISGCDAVCTFDPHPLAVLDPGGAPPLLTDLERRARLVGALDVEELVVLPFDDSMRSLSPEAFVADVLLGRLGATHVRVGASFRFGHRAAGTAATLAADSRLACRIVEPVVVGGTTVSSTRIRALVAAGAVMEAAELLGTPHAVRCTTVPSRRPGGGLLTLVPVAGLAVPAAGAYAGRLHDLGRPRQHVPCDVTVCAERERPTLLAGPVHACDPAGDVVVEFLARDPSSAGRLTAPHGLARAAAGRPS